MKFISTKEFKADHAWGSLPIANMRGITTKLHWTDQPYQWHVNDGEEVFVVLEGYITMYYKESGIEKYKDMEPGDIFFASVGVEHFAKPKGIAKVLVVEQENSI